MFVQHQRSIQCICGLKDELQPDICSPGIYLLVNKANAQETKCNAEADNECKVFSLLKNNH